jgi:hypothetical protein
MYICRPKMYGQWVYLASDCFDDNCWLSVQEILEMKTKYEDELRKERESNVRYRLVLASERPVLTLYQTYRGVLEPDRTVLISDVWLHEQQKNCQVRQSQCQVYCRLVLSGRTA